MDIKIDVKPEDIEQAVKDAIINSSIGKMIEQKVRDATSDYNLNRAVEEALKHAVLGHARDLIYQDQEFAAKIKAKLVEKLDDAFITSVANKIARAVERDY
jgi:hypothetical protein